jgi:hypothetical protein
VEVTTQACGITGYKDTTVKLTREQYQDLEEYLVEFRARLNQTSTREEAVPIFKDAVVELDKYGLLPRGMSVERAQKLFTKLYDKRVKVLDSLELDPDANYICLVAGITSDTKTYGPLAYLINRVAWYLEEHNAPELFVTLAFLLEYFWLIPIGLTMFIPFGLLSVLFFGVSNYWRILSSSGWVFSIGLNGYKKFNGSELWGTASERISFLSVSALYPGVLGFTGLKITLLNDNFDKTFFLGSALKVKLGTEFPG